MTVNRAVLWALMALCCVPSVLITLRARLPPATRGDARGRRTRVLGACADALLTGVGVGLLVALAVLAVAALGARVFG